MKHGGSQREAPRALFDARTHARLRVRLARVLLAINQALQSIQVCAPLLLKEHQHAARGGGVSDRMVLVEKPLRLYRVRVDPTIHVFFEPPPDVFAQHVLGVLFLHLARPSKLDEMMVCEGAGAARV